MTANPKRSLTALAAVLVLGGLTAGCGKMGALDKPAPLWGAAEKAKYNAERRAASAKANRPSKPGSVQENVDPATSTATVHQTPAPGSNPNPSDGPTGPGFPGSGPQ
jgi:hypothetical protein